MIVLSDCLTETADEGCLKVAATLTKRLRAADSGTMVISYDRHPAWSDRHMQLNRLFLNPELLRTLRRYPGRVLYIPFASNTLASMARLCVLSLACRKRLQVLFALRHPMNGLSRRLLRLSGAKVLTLSAASCAFYKDAAGDAVQLRAGVETKRFRPVSAGKKAELRKKYGVAEGKKVLLHVGHLNRGRNVGALLGAGEDYHVFLVVSTVTEADEALRRELLARPNTTIIDEYLPEVQEIYQMADVYLFPVLEQEHCIDVPLSVLEAASCNVPVVTTAYGELTAFRGERGFEFLEDLSPGPLNAALDRMSALTECDNRHAVKPYDWDHAVARLLKIR